MERGKLFTLAQFDLYCRGKKLSQFAFDTENQVHIKSRPMGRTVVWFNNVSVSPKCHTVSFWEEKNCLNLRNICRVVVDDSDDFIGAVITLCNVRGEKIVILGIMEV